MAAQVLAYIAIEKVVLWGLAAMGVAGTAAVVYDNSEEIAEGAEVLADAARCAVGGCPDPKCPPLIAKIDEMLNRARMPGTQSGTKGIKQRYCEQNHGSMPPGSAGYDVHTAEILAQQTGIVARYSRAIALGCPIPPGMHMDVGRYGTRRPSASDYSPMPTFKEYCYGTAKLRREG